MGKRKKRKHKYYTLLEQIAPGDWRPQFSTPKKKVAKAALKEYHIGQGISKRHLAILVTEGCDRDDIEDATQLESNWKWRHTW